MFFRKKARCISPVLYFKKQVKCTRQENVPFLTSELMIDLTETFGTPGILPYF